MNNYTKFDFWTEELLAQMEDDYKERLAQREFVKYHLTEIHPTWQRMYNRFYTNGLHGGMVFTTFWGGSGFAKQELSHVTVRRSKDNYRIRVVPIVTDDIGYTLFNMHDQDMAFPFYTQREHQKNWKVNERFQSSAPSEFAPQLWALYSALGCQYQWCKNPYLGRQEAPFYIARDGNWGGVVAVVSEQEYYLSLEEEYGDDIDLDKLRDLRKGTK